MWMSSVWRLQDIVMIWVSLLCVIDVLIDGIDRVVLID
jgi:hypothetical protein